MTPKRCKAEEEQDGDDEAPVHLALNTCLQTAATVTGSGSVYAHPTKSGASTWLLP